MTTGTTAWSKANKTGLVLLALCGVANLIPPPPGGPSDVGPPMSVIVADFILGVIIIAAVIIAFRTNSTGAVWAAVAALFLTVLSAIPAFFVDGVPTPVRILVAVFIAVAIVAAVLSLSKPKQ